jgi:hypothetical protein
MPLHTSREGCEDKTTTYILSLTGRTRSPRRGGLERRHAPPKSLLLAGVGHIRGRAPTA